MYGNVEVMKFILQTSQASLNVTDKDKDTPLHWAAYHNKTNMVKHLLTYDNIDVDVKNNDGKTADEHGNNKIKELIQTHRKK